MKKLVLAVALAVSNLVSAQSFDFKFSLFFYFIVPTSDTSNFKIEKREDISNLIYNRHAEISAWFGDNDVEIRNNKLVNHIEIESYHMVTRYRDFKNLKFTNNILTFVSKGEKLDTHELYDEYFFFDLNELQKTDRDPHTTFAVSYWRMPDGTIHGNLITNGAIDKFSIE